MFEQTLMESAGMTRSRRALTTSLTALAQLALLSLAILLPMIFTQTLPLLKPQSVMPMPVPRFTPPEPEEVMRRSNVSGPTTANQAVIVTNAFPRVRSLVAPPNHQDTVTLPAGTGTGPVNYDLLIGTRDPVVNVSGPGALPRSQLDEGRIIRRIQPIYPAIARAAGIEGEVVIEAVISRNGGIEGLKVISGHPVLAAAAKEAVGQWTFRPYVLNGKPIDVITQIKVDFKLRREER